jgi:hypothetical protein
LTATVEAKAGKQTCSSCGGAFIGRAGASYCSPACKQRAHRSRKGANRNASGVTVTAAPAGARAAEAVALLDALDQDLAAAGAERGESLMWSAQDEAIRELIASAVDREVWLRAATCSSTDDLKLRMKLSAELRLTEAHRARLIRQIKTDLPAPESFRTRKARSAARARWDRSS